MNCKKARGLLSEYLDGRLEPTLSEGLEAHLRGCEECAAQLAGLRTALQKVQSLPSVPLPEGFVEKVGAAVRQRAKEQPAKNRWQMVRWLAPAFGVLVIFMFTWVFTQPGGYRGTGPTMAERMKSRGGSPGRSDLTEKSKEAGAQRAAPPAAGAPKGPAALEPPGKPAETLSSLGYDKVEQEEFSKKRAGAAEEKDAQGITEKSAPQLGYADGGALRGGESRVKRQADTEALHESEVRALETAPEMAALSAPPRTVSVRVGAQQGVAGRPEIIFRVEANRPAGIFSLRVSSEAGEKQEWRVDLQNQQSQALPPFRPPVRAEGATMWNVSLTEKPSTPAQEDKTLLQEEYRLFVPSRLLSPPPQITVAYDEFIQEEVLADLSEQAGLVIFAPPASIEGVKLSVKEVAADSVIGQTAVSFGQRVEFDGLARNFIADESPPAAAGRARIVPPAPE